MPASDHHKEGAVLIIVLLVLATATYLIMESGKYLRIDYEGAALQRVMVAGGNLLRSGQTIAIELLKDDLLETKGVAADHRFDNWAAAHVFFEEISNILESGEIEGDIVPENSRFNLNSLKGKDAAAKDAQNVFIRLVSGLTAAHSIDGSAAAYLKSIRLWLGDANVKDDQGDASWYSQREPSYSMRKGEFITPDELFLVRWNGMSDEDRLKVLNGGGGVPGLMELITVWGEKKINMNMVPRTLLGAICPNSELREDFIESVESYRSQGANLFSGNWYLQIAREVGVEDGFPTTILQSTSSYFRVSLTARVGNGLLNSTSIIHRTSNGGVVLFENIH